MGKAMLAAAELLAKTQLEQVPREEYLAVLHGHSKPVCFFFLQIH
jgi:hypothetical protein